MPDAYRPPLTLVPVAPAAAAARRYVADILTELSAQSVLDSAELGVSELVSNAVLHARTPLTVTVRAGHVGVVRIEVTDGSALSAAASPEHALDDGPRAAARGPRSGV